MMKKYYFHLFIIALIVLGIGIFIFNIKIVRRASKPLQKPEKDTPLSIARKYPIADSSNQKEASPSASPIPSPTPLSFADMNQLYGPCVSAPVLMYHHIQSLDVAKAAGHASLTVDTQTFRKHMQYLKDKGYAVLGLNDLIAFFDQNIALPKKTIFLTFDDGYEDFVTDAIPVLNEFQYKSTLFVSTGLVDNPGYARWDSLAGIRDRTLLANHTWSHHGMGLNGDVDRKEIGLADTQLQERGMNSPKTFAFPYGGWSPVARTILQEKGYQLAFTTQHGSILCKKQRLTLPRIRVGNAALSAYGL